MKKSRRLIIGCLLVTLIAIAVLYPGSSNLNKSQSTIATLVNNGSTKNQKIERLISRAKLTRLFKKANSSELQVNLYPIKYTGDPSKNDFDLAVFYSDKSQGLIEQELKLSVEDFWTMSNYYVTYIKEKKKSTDQLPNGYELLVYKYQFDGKGDVVFSVSREDQSATVYVDLCRRPPGCPTILRTSVLLVSDTCRYPPGCPR